MAKRRTIVIAHQEKGTLATVRSEGQTVQTEKTGSVVVGVREAAPPVLIGERRTSVVNEQRSSVVQAPVTRPIAIQAGGNQGPAGPGLSPDILKLAAVPLSALRAVYLAADGLRYASCDDLANVDAVLGIAFTSGGAGELIRVRGNGSELSDQSWSWTPNAPIYLGFNGLLTQTPTDDDADIELGFALTPTSMLVRITTPIFTE